MLQGDSNKGIVLGTNLVIFLSLIKLLQLITTSTRYLNVDNECILGMGNWVFSLLSPHVFSVRMPEKLQLELFSPLSCNK